MHTCRFLNLQVLARDWKTQRSSTLTLRVAFSPCPPASPLNTTVCFIYFAVQSYSAPVFGVVVLAIESKTMADQLSVLFVCLGNICRSTMAEGVFQSLARKPPYEELVGKVDSCGTGSFSLFLAPLGRT